MKLTIEEKRIKLAEACGWKIVFNTPSLVCGDKRSGTLLDPEGGRRGFLWIAKGDTLADHSFNLPDYFNDLNAIHEAEKVLNEDQWDVYTDKLDDMTAYNHGHATRSPHATAGQRAEAFGQTIDLWEAGQ